jgi:hypothetical protein
MANGRHPVYLTALDTAKRTVTFDLILFLGGEQARKEWAKQHPEDPEGPPNDYLIVNNNPRLRTLVVAPKVTVTVLDLDHLPQSVPIPFADLPAYFAKPGFDHDKYLSSAPFWLTVVKGKVVSFEEQYLP